MANKTRENEDGTRFYVYEGGRREEAWNRVTGQ